MLGSLAYPPSDIIPVPLPTYNKNHHTEKGFTNNPGEPRHPGYLPSFKKFLVYLLSGTDTPSPLPIVNPVPIFTKPPIKSNGNCIRCFWIGHACCLIQFNDTFIITDPVFSGYASPIPFAFKRVTPVPCEIEDLPEISVVLLSHDHYDHLDFQTLRRIKKHSPKSIVFAPLVLSNLINMFGISCVPFDWRQHVTYKNIDFTCFPARHAASRLGIDFRERLWCSWLLNINDGESVIYFPGDTAIGPHFSELHDFVASNIKSISDEPRTVDLAMLPIAPQEPCEVMRSVHLDPPDAYEMQKLLKAKQVFPIHYGTFPMGRKPEIPDIELMQKVWEEDNLHILNIGEYMEWNGKEFFYPNDKNTQ